MATVMVVTSATKKEVVTAAAMVTAGIAAARVMATAVAMAMAAVMTALRVMCYENKVLWYLLTVLDYQSHVTSL